MRRASAALAVVAVLLLAGCRTSKDTNSSSSSSRASSLNGAITVSAASSLTDAFTTIADGFERANPGATVTLNFGSSGVLATQIEQGAPVDTFAAADTTTMSALQDAGLVVGAPRVFARNRLVIVTKPGNPEGIRTVTDLADAGTIALCAPSAPCGKYAAQVLAAARTTIAESDVTRGVDARSTISSVTAGDADAAIVYVTDADAAGDAVTRVAIPEAQNVIAAYPIATLTGARDVAVSEAFVAYVLSPTGRSALRAAGFLAAP